MNKIYDLCTSTVKTSLTRVDVRYNALGMQDKDVLRKAVEGRSGFELLL